jgi:hypothetical protein
VEISIDPAKTEVIMKWRFEDLYNKSAVRSFLGLYNYVRIFYHHASGLAEPLNRLLKKNVPFEQGLDQKQAFKALKKLACKALILAFFQPGRPTRVESDASHNITGDVVL